MIIVAMHLIESIAPFYVRGRNLGVFEEKYFLGKIDLLIILVK